MSRSGPGLPSAPDGSRFGERLQTATELGDNDRKTRPRLHIDALVTRTHLENLARDVG